MNDETKQAITRAKRYAKSLHAPIYVYANTHQAWLSALRTPINSTLQPVYIAKP